MCPTGKQRIAAMMTYKRQTDDQEYLLTSMQNDTTVEYKPGGSRTESVQWSFLPFLIPVVIFAEVGNSLIIFLVALVRRFRR